MRISDGSSDVCSSVLLATNPAQGDASLRWHGGLVAKAADPLARYNAKRDFAKTAEPAGTLAKGPGNAFMVQKHDATRLHWDLRLETGTRSEEHTSELQSLMRISYPVFCLKKTKNNLYKKR